MLLANIFHVIGISLSGSFVLMLILVIFGAIHSNKQSEVEALLEREDKANPMDLTDVKDYYLVWIDSCDKRIQLEQLEKSMKNFFSKRFSGKVPPYQLIEATDEIIDTINTKKFTIVKHKFIDLWCDIPTLSYHLKY